MTNNPDNKLTLNALSDMIHRIHAELSVQTSRAVNVSLTLRNWLIGCYIAEYELHGTDRELYGERVLAELANRIDHVTACNSRQLYDYIRFYRTYPQILQTVSAKLHALLPIGVSAYQITQSLLQELKPCLPSVVSE